MHPVITHDLDQQVGEIIGNRLKLKGKKILILEDDVAFATSLQAALECYGCKVTHVPSGAEGVRFILATDFDVIVCDMVMPNFPGDMFYLAVQRARPHLCKRFIFITGHKGNPKITQFIIETGCQALWKPFELSRLFVAIESVIH